MKTISISQGTNEWHKWRLSGIGASDAPVIEGVSPYKTPRQLFFEKRGEVKEQEGNEFIFEKGHKTEGLIRKQFQDLTGVEMKPLCVVHPNFDYIIASLDGFDSRLGVLEAKLVGQEALNDAKNSGSIPRHHFIQMQHQFAVTGANEGQWFGHDGKKTGIVVPVKADQKLIENLLFKEQSFWQDIKDGKIPTLTDQDYLVPEDLTLLNQLREAKEFIENATINYENLKNKIVEIYKHPKISGAGVKVFKVTRQGSIDYKSIPELKTLENEYLETFRKTGSTSWSVIMDKKAVK